MRSSDQTSRKRFKKEHNQCKRFFLNQDAFGSPMEVTYNEDSTSYTICGGIASTFLRLGIFVFTVWRLKLCMHRDRNDIISTNIFRKFPEEGHYTLKDSEFKLWAQVVDPEFDNDNNPYCKLKFFIWNTERDFQKDKDQRESFGSV